MAYREELLAKGWASISFTAGAGRVRGQPEEWGNYQETHRYRVRAFDIRRGVCRDGDPQLG